MNEPARSSGLKTTSTQIVTRPCRYYGFQFNGPSATQTLIIYDTGSAQTDTIRILDKHVLSGADNSAREWLGPNGIECLNGLYVTVTGSAEYIIYYALM
jgi:hypothetical protein